MSSLTQKERKDYAVSMVSWNRGAGNNRLIMYGALETLSTKFALQLGFSEIDLLYLYVKYAQNLLFTLSASVRAYV